MVENEITGTEQTPAEIVRQAVERLSTAVAGTSPSPWSVAPEPWRLGGIQNRYVRTEADRHWAAVALTGDLRDANSRTDCDAAYIALMHPAVADALADWLQIIADDMSDERAEEREFPNHIPAARWQVVDWAGREMSGWTEALALARAILRLPNPNRTEAA